TDHINKLYFFDLTGAALGCFAIVLIIPFLGGSGTVLSASVLAAIAAIVFIPKKSWIVFPVAWAVLVAAVLPRADQLLPTTMHTEKRYFDESVKNGQLEYTGWSPASRIDVVSIVGDTKVIWIDGGTNQSFLRHYHKVGKFTAGNDSDDEDDVWKTLE